MIDQTWKEAWVEKAYLMILNRIIKDRRALRNGTAMKIDLV